ncbi:hypothetical protein AK812_SmicGene8632 [Symbiodinium microadriaticum]|uniref:Uncharacterized protein n=1 Tax=Symbiodinium microadriaticum TaxID=2951 RepID=A0A1Q9EKC3_SYMMI|nr:hypothetical protein AK812_SmicGene8632 [Symbiodinium microadriaticum]
MEEESPAATLPQCDDASPTDQWLQATGIEVREANTSFLWQMRKWQDVPESDEPEDTTRAKQMLQLDFLPSFFCRPAILVGEQLHFVVRVQMQYESQNMRDRGDGTGIRDFEIAFCHLSASGSRNYMLTFDDTVFAKDFSLMQGIRDKAVMIGGAYPDDCCIVPDENGQFPDLN